MALRLARGAAITGGRSNPNEKARRASDRSRTDCFRWCMRLCLLRGDVKHDARCGLASSMCGYSRIAVDRLEWFQTLGRLLCYVDFSLCANRNRIPNDPVDERSTPGHRSVLCLRCRLCLW